VANGDRGAELHGRLDDKWSSTVTTRSEVGRGVKDEREVEDERRSHAHPNALYTPWEECFFVPHRTLFEIRVALDGKENVKASYRTL
jgi:hypothetical protein